MEEKHHLVVVGILGTKRAYLDISQEEALERYISEELQDYSFLTREGIQEDIERNGRLHEFDFTDEFMVYDAWSLEE